MLRVYSFSLLVIRIWLTLGDSDCLLLIRQEIVLHEEISFCRRIDEDGSEASHSPPRKSSRWSIGVRVTKKYDVPENYG